MLFECVATYQRLREATGQDVIWVRCDVPEVVAEGGVQKREARVPALDELVKDLLCVVWRVV